MKIDRPMRMRFATLLTLGVAFWLVPTARALELPADVFASGSPALTLPASVFAAQLDEDLVDVVIFGRDRAAIMRVHIMLGDKGFRTAWTDFMLSLQAYLDVNDDGVLSTAEANRAPWTQLFEDPFNRRPFQVGKRPVALDSSPRDGIVTVEELSNYLRATHEIDGLGMNAGAAPDPRLEAVFGHLDHDGDKVLSSAELADTDACVARLDTDEDEMVGMDELSPDRSPLADRFGQRNQAGSVDTATSPIVALASSDTRQQVIARLVRKYGVRANDQAYRIGPAALGADPAAFQTADRDGDGGLDERELKEFLAKPTMHLELHVILPKEGRGPGQIVGKPAGPKAHALATRATNDGGQTVSFDGSDFVLRPFDVRQQPGDFYQNQFKSADADNNGILDAKEARGNFFMNRIFPVADRNGDAKMTAAELSAYVEHSRQATESRAALTVADLGLALHERLDADHDGRLSIRELRAAYERLKDLDRDGDGRINQAELPRRTQLTIGRGIEQNNGRRVVFANNRGVPGGAANRGDRPAWFVGMDRNGDGDVSPREFLGTADQFRDFDTDHDGLIDAREAAKAP